MAAPSPGSFEYLEAKIRRDADGTLFGRDFEWVCQWYLEHAPLYRGKFRRVWRWAEWPDRWGRDCGIDLVAETQDGKLWAIQAKAVGPDNSITKAEIDSFLSESNRPQIAFRLLIGTTDNIGANARRTIDEQAKHASVVLRGDLVSADIVWPTRVGGAAPKPKRAKPRPHQRKAISAVLRGFRKHNRGRLIMACGTGKTLTGLWIHERLKSRRTLLLVPSISLVQQNLREWGRHAREDFDFLVVCSDESVASDRDDPALRYIAELGIDVTTDAKDIAAFLAKRRRRPAVVIATYQSSDRVSAGQRKARKAFDLALCDEAHRLVGDMRGKFATVLDDRKIRCRRRLFMTATPRYFTQRARQRAADQDLEVASMDDPATFGPEFHVLKFYDAITEKPMPLLTDYRVVVIGVTNAEAAQWVEEGKLVRTREGAETDACTLAAQIGLAKAMREYDLRRVITFHRSIRRASRFVDSERRDSLPAIIETLRPASRPSGKLWARHISGETPASKRASMLRELAELPSQTRGLIANCACLGEGVDVPALDGIAFIDPKGSMVDIIQAVGRVIRLSKDKTIGTIVIPVFVDETADADHALEQSAFDPVWQVLKALRAHDARLADELDALRACTGRQSGRITLPANVVLDVPHLVIGDFEQAFYARAVERVAQRPPLTIEQILKWADMHRGKTGEWPRYDSGKIDGTDLTWNNVGYSLLYARPNLPRGLTLPLLLHKYRGVHNRVLQPPLSIKQVLAWADAYKTATGSWPIADSGPIEGTTDTWNSVDSALRAARRGISHKTSLARVLFRYRGVENIAEKEPLDPQAILKWAKAFYHKFGRWPGVKSKPVRGQKASWASIDHCMRSGLRGCQPGGSLAIFLESQLGVVNSQRKPPLRIQWIVHEMKMYRSTHGEWPNIRSGRIAESNETWGGVELALTRRRRGVKTKTSLADLRQRYLGVVNPRDQSSLTLSWIKTQIRKHFRRTGHWPNTQSGSIPGSSETWQKVASALWGGLRGIAVRTTLGNVVAEINGGPRKYTVTQVRTWAKEYFASHGKLPSQGSGAIPGEDVTWQKLDNYLRTGSKGLPKSGSLPQLLRDLTLDGLAPRR